MYTSKLKIKTSSVNA